MGGEVGSRVRVGPRSVADLGLYAVVLTAVLTAVATVASLLFTGRLVAAKWLLFVAGFWLMALGAWKLRPPPAWRDGAGRFGLENSRGDGRLQGLVDRLPPLRAAPPVDAERFSDGTKLLTASVLTLAVSVLLELGGVGP